MYGIAEAASNARRHKLTKTEEIRLHAAYMAGDESAGRRIVTSYLPMLMKATPSHDALGVAVEAFMDNMTRYDPAKGTRMWTYLAMPVNQAVLRYDLDRKAFFALKDFKQRKAAISLEAEKKKLGASGRQLTGREARILADVFGVSENLIHGLDDGMSIMRADPLSHDRSDHHGVEDPERAGGHLDFEQRHDHERLMTRLEGALAALSEREREVIARRFKDMPDHLKTIGADMGVSKERVRQIETKALLRLRRAMGARTARASRKPIPKRLAFRVQSEFASKRCARAH